MRTQKNSFIQPALRLFGLVPRLQTKGSLRQNLLLCLSFLLLSCCQAAAQTPMADSLLNTRLFQTIRLGDAGKLQALLQEGANPNAVSLGYSALMAAALNGSAEEMEVLIQHGADVHYRNGDSITAFWLAVPDEEKTRLLLAHGAKTDVRSREGNTVLVKLAISPGSAALMQLLIEKGCDPRKAGPHNDVMCNAAGSGDTAMVGLLLRYGVSVNDTSATGDYPVNAATNFRTFGTLKMLVDNGANVNVSSKTAVLPLLIGITPLMWAAISNDKPSFYYLLQHGADANAKSPRGYTPLMFLSMADVDDPEMIRALVRHGADPTMQAPDVTDALFYASQKGTTQSVELLSGYKSKQR
jgi:ankyrin repeat protein